LAALEAALPCEELITRLGHMHQTWTLQPWGGDGALLRPTAARDSVGGATRALPRRRPSRHGRRRARVRVAVDPLYRAEHSGQVTCRVAPEFDPHHMGERCAVSRASLKALDHL